MGASPSFTTAWGSHVLSGTVNRIGAAAVRLPARPAGTQGNELFPHLSLCLCLLGPAPVTLGSMRLPWARIDGS